MGKDMETEKYFQWPRVSKHEVKTVLDMVKYLHKNENNIQLKHWLAESGEILNRLVNQKPTSYPRGTRKLST
jgi:hypothetical protein